MIESYQFQVPNNDNQFNSATSLQNALVDSGVRVGTNIWDIFIELPLITGNSISVIINGTTVTQAFSVDNTTTLDAFVATILALNTVQACTWDTVKRFVDDVSYGYKVTITSIDNAQLVAGTLTLTGGATQPKFFLKESQFLRIVPGLVVVNQDAVELLRTDVAGAGVTYNGYALTGTLNTANSWKIARVTVVGAITTIEYADGNSGFDNIWNDRATLTYS